LLPPFLPDMQNQRRAQRLQKQQQQQQQQQRENVEVVAGTDVVDSTMQVPKDAEDKTAAEATERLAEEAKMAAAQEADTRVTAAEMPTTETPKATAAAEATETSVASGEHGDDAEGEGHNVEAAYHGPERSFPEAKATLAAVLEVNRVLHRTLAERRQLLKSSEATVSLLEERMVGSTVEEPLRQRQLAELKCPRTPSAKMAREAKLLAREEAKLEAKIEEMNTKNMQLAERHRLDRERAAECHSRLKTLGRRERKLSQHLEVMANELTAVSDGLARIDVSRQPVYYWNLSGLCVHKLLARGNLSEKSPRSRDKTEQKISGQLNG